MQNVNQNTELMLHDIKPILEIQDYSVYYFLTVLFLGSILIIAILYLIYKWYKNKKRINLRKEYYKKLKSINLKDTKTSAYNITKYGAIFRDDTPQHREVYEELLHKLENYKYKKEVENFDKEVLEYIKLYKGMIDV